MRETPNQLDGADVLCWAVSARGGFYVLAGSEPVTVVAMAVARYASGEVYLFKCDESWQVVQDWDCDSVEEARRMAATHTDEPLVWSVRS